MRSRAGRSGIDVESGKLLAHIFALPFRARLVPEAFRAH